MQYDKFYNGIGMSKNDINAFDNIVNCDVHSVLGTAKPNLALSNESTTPNENCLTATNELNGDMYFFSTVSGKTWKRAYGAGTYSLVNTNANGGHQGARFFNGYIYYTSGVKLGRYDLSSTWTDSWQTFSQTSSYMRAMVAVGISLYIGNGVYVASVDNTNTFSDNVLDLRTGYKVTTLAGRGDDLVVGTSRGGVLNDCSAFIWDTFSPSWRTEYFLNEKSFNCFIKAEDVLFASCGNSGNIYYLDGGFKFFKKIRGATVTINHYAHTIYGSRALFATGTAVYSIHRAASNLSFAIVQEYTAGASIMSIMAGGDDLFVSIGTAIQKQSTSYATATIDTPEMDGPANNVIITYDSYPTGVGISTNSNNSGSYTAKTPVVDTIRRIIYFNGGLLDSRQTQARITLTPSGANIPIINSIEIR